MKARITSMTRLAVAMLLGLGMSGGLAHAGEWVPMGARYQGMGGSGVAAVSDSMASYWNPAALATKKTADGAINFDFLASIEGNAIQTIDGVEEQFDETDIEDIIETLENTGTVTPAQEARLDDLVEELRKLDDDGIGAVGAAGTGLNLRWQQIAVFSRGEGHFAIDPVFDSQRVATDNNDADDSLAFNESGARVRGLGVLETGVGYGHQFVVPFADMVGLESLGTISVGANLKHLHGWTYTKYVGYQSLEDAKIEFDDSDLREESDNFGLDIGLLYEPFRFLAIGMTARNVNSPKFDVGNDRDDPQLRKNFTLDAQVRGGIAVYPFEDRSLVIASDLDLTENESDLLKGFKSRLWTFGAEYTLPIPVVTMALRGGGYLNTVDDADQSFVFTGGLGLRAWLFSLDLAGAASPNTIEISEDGDEIPSRINFSAILALRGNF